MVNAKKKYTLPVWGRRGLLTVPIVGGGIVFLSLFLPWFKLELDSELSFTVLELDSELSFTVSGFSIATAGDFATLVFIDALAIIGISIYMLKRQTPWKSQIPVLAGSGIGLLCVWLVLRGAMLYVPKHIYPFITISVGTRMARAGETPTAQSIMELSDLQLGGFVAAAGFMIAFIGACSLRKSDPLVGGEDA